jgi:transposase
MQTASTGQVIIPHVALGDKSTRWFSSSGCVVWRSDRKDVFVDGTLISSFGPGEAEVRNLTLVGLGGAAGIKKGKLAEAFGISAELLRQLRRQYEESGIEGIRPAERRGPRGKVTAALRAQFIELFEQDGMNAHQAYIELGEAAGVCYRVVRRIRQTWSAAHRNSPADTASPDQLGLGMGEDGGATGDDEVEADGAARALESRAGGVKASARAGEVVEGEAPRSSVRVRHLGCWLLMAMVHAYGLQAALLRHWRRSRQWRERLRVVVDAMVAALGIGQRCVEGVRRLEAASGDVLLRAKRVPSSSWARRVLKDYVKEASASYVHLAMTQNYLERAAARQEGPTVFYVDNHLRPYTGKHTVRKGWRMQDKRVVPGNTDYYVHDEDGRPVYRLTVASHGSLTAWLTPVLQILRTALGEAQRLLVSFDRGGAYAEQLAALRDEGFEFVTYERRPYQQLAASAFGERVTVGEETYGVHESRLANLGKGRGRVRRIALLTPEGNQVNLLAVSGEKKERLIEVMLGRWVQENGFKHGKERWGINQLDQRKVAAYPPETVIPNPARRRADNALRLARHREGDARNQLARLPVDDRRRAKVEEDLAQALAEQELLEAQRPQLPKHAPLQETELKDKLVYHLGDYKTLIDTIRIACANAESELAVVLARDLRRPAEAKKVLANLFAAPGQVRVNGKSITVTLEPAGNHNEQEAMEGLLQEVNRWKLTLPGDPKARPLCFRSQIS